MGTLTERWEALKAQKTAADRALAGAEADEATATANLNTAVAAVTEAGFDSIGAVFDDVPLSRRRQRNPQTALEPFEAIERNSAAVFQ